LFALLSGYLSDGSTRNQAELLVPANSTPMSIMSSLRLPIASCSLVVINGTFVHVADRATRRLADGDVLAIWRRSLVDDALISFKEKVSAIMAS
jgi:sulfur carrier protein ThiS